ncbi:MAG: hypothetical protein PHV82_04185, partial [Victivallaceae bacterium]|nr:hypothetical protein [Victivallaceae bacterium]
EEQPFSRSRFNEMLDLAEKGLKEIFALQRSLIDGNAAKNSKPKRVKPGQEIGSLGDVLGDIEL